MGRARTDNRQDRGTEGFMEFEVGREGQTDGQRGEGVGEEGGSEACRHGRTVLLRHLAWHVVFLPDMTEQCGCHHGIWWMSRQ